MGIKFLLLATVLLCEFESAVSAENEEESVNLNGSGRKKSAASLACQELDDFLITSYWRDPVVAWT